MLDSIFSFLSSDMKTVASVSTIIVGGIVVYSLMKRGLKLLAERGALAVPLIRLFRLFMRWTVVSVVILLVLQELGILHNVWTGLLTIMAMVAAGFVAVWSILSNILSTLLILVYRPFRIGDEIKIPSDVLEGKVVDLNLMFTTLETDENQLVQIPNNQFFQKATIRIKTEQKDISLYDQLIKLTNKS